MKSRYRIRRARHSDLETLVVLTEREAREAEGLELAVDRVRTGVRAGLEDPSKSTYWVAESTDGLVVASTSVVTEWSNFNGGYYWWIQSLFIVPEYRGRGLVELLLDNLTEAAREAQALDLRLYVHLSNQRAQNAYVRCGFENVQYAVMKKDLGAPLRGGNSEKEHHGFK